MSMRQLETWYGDGWRVTFMPARMIPGLMSVERADGRRNFDGRDECEAASRGTGFVAEAAQVALQVLDAKEAS